MVEGSGEPEGMKMAAARRTIEEAMISDSAQVVLRASYDQQLIIHHSIHESGPAASSTRSF